LLLTAPPLVANPIFALLMRMELPPLELSEYDENWSEDNLYRGADAGVNCHRYT